MNYKLIIWDFNGTIVDDTKLSIDAVNTVLSRRSLPTLAGKAAHQELFCFPVEEYYRRLGFDFEKEPYKIPADEWAELYHAGKFSSQLSPGVRETLEKFSAAGLRQIILSASEKVLLCEQLRHLGVYEFFEDVLGTDNVYAAGKADLCEKWLSGQKKEDITPALLIGDTDHDYICAQKIGCDCILYSGGFMSRKRLEKLGVPVVDKIENIIDFVLP